MNKFHIGVLFKIFLIRLYPSVVYCLIAVAAELGETELHFLLVALVVRILLRSCVHILRLVIRHLLRKSKIVSLIRLFEIWTLQIYLLFIQVRTAHLFLKLIHNCLILFKEILHSLISVWVCTPQIPVECVFLLAVCKWKPLLGLTLCLHHFIIFNLINIYSSWALICNFIC